MPQNAAKITNPHFKKLYRIYENDTKKAIADLMTVYDEPIDESKPLTLFDPDFTWKRKTITNFTVRELLEPVFVKGECVYKPRSIQEIKDYCTAQVETLWDEVTRFENPHNYYVDLSQALWDEKHRLLNENGR